MSLIPIVQGGHSTASDFNTTLIGNSVWFDSGDYFSQDSAASDSGRKEAIFSTWLQRSKFGEQGMFMCVNGSSATDYLVLDFQSDDTLRLLAYDVTILVTSQVFRDVGWYHILVTIDTSQNSNASQKIFVNGEEVTSFSTRNNFGSSADIGWGRNQTHLVNSSPTSVGSNQMIGYMAQTALITDKSFQQGDYSITDFVDAFTIGTNGSQFVPKKNADIATIVGAGGNNSFLLTYQNSSDLGNDGSSKNNDFTVNSMGSANQSSNTPSKVYSTFNPLAHADNSFPGSFTLSEGNTKNVLNSSNTSVKTTLPFVMSGSNIIRTQFTFNTVGNGACGITGSSHTSGTYHTAATSVAGRGEVLLIADGSLVIDGNFGASGYTSALSNGDVVDVIVNCDAGAVYFAVNGTLGGSATQSEILAGTTTNAALVSSFVRRTAGEVFNFYVAQTNPSSSTITYNSGQSSFSNSYSTITSLVSLNSADLPAPTHQGIDHFNSVKYAGNGTAIGSGGKAVTGVGFQPDFVWIKNRDASDSHALYDVVRGTTKQIETDTTAIETTEAEGLSTFGSDGFTLGSLAQVNTSSEDFISWNWLAGGSASSNDSGSITSSVSAAAPGHFSIVSWTGNTTAGATVGHGLGGTPEFIIAIARNEAGENKPVYHGFMTSDNDHLKINENNAQGTAGTTIWDVSAMSSTVIGLGAAAQSNSTNGMIALCFRSVSGVCKVGRYIPNNVTNGPYVSLGFTPSFLLIKCVQTTNPWIIFDNARDTSNPVTPYLLANSNAQEASSGRDIDLLADSFKIREDDSDTNGGTSNTYLFLAMADIAGGSGLPPILGR